MARIHGRFARVYIDITGSGSAEPVPFINSFSIDRSTDRAEVTAMGDGNKVFVTGLPNAEGSYGGFYDSATAQTYTAASDGLARKSYFYSDVNSPTTDYWYTTAFWDFSFESGVGDGQSISGSWAAATDLIKVA